MATSTSSPATAALADLHYSEYLRSSPQRLETAFPVAKAPEITPAPPPSAASATATAPTPSPLLPAEETNAPPPKFSHPSPPYPETPHVRHKRLPFLDFLDVSCESLDRLSERSMTLTVREINMSTLLQEVECCLHNYIEYLEYNLSEDITLPMLNSVSDIVQFQSKLLTCALTTKEMNTLSVITALTDTVLRALKSKLPSKLFDSPNYAWVHATFQHPHRRLRRARGDIDNNINMVHAAAAAKRMEEVERLVKEPSVAECFDTFEFQLRAALMTATKHQPQEMWNNCEQLVTMCLKDIEALTKEIKDPQTWNIPMLMQILANVMSKLQGLRLSGQSKKAVLLTCLQAALTITRPKEEVEAHLDMLSSLIDTVVIVSKTFAPFLKRGWSAIRKFLCCGKK